MLLPSHSHTIVCFPFDSMFSIFTQILPHSGRDQQWRLATSNWTKTFSIELHKANLLGLEVQYYPYPAPLSPFQAGPLAQMPKLPAQMWPPGPHQGASTAPQSASSSSAAQPTSVSLQGAVCAFKKENLPCVEHYWAYPDYLREAIIKRKLNCVLNDGFT